MERENKQITATFHKEVGLAGKGAPETRQTGPIGQKAMVTIIRASDALVRSFDLLFKAHGLTATQYDVLRVLRGAGGAGAACSAIGERLIKAEPDVTRLLDRLERRGWVRRERNVRDRRSVTTWITIPGLKLLRDLDGPVRDQNLKPFKLMSVAEVRQLVSGLEKVLEALTPKSRDERRS